MTADQTVRANFLTKAQKIEKTPSKHVLYFSEKGSLNIVG